MGARTATTGSGEKPWQRSDVTKLWDSGGQTWQGLTFVREKRRGSIRGREGGSALSEGRCEGIRFLGTA